MILSATFSKPNKTVEETLKKPFVRVKIRAANTADESDYFAEFFTEKQAFHKKFTASELDEFIEAHAGKTFKNCIVRTESEETTIFANRRGEIKQSSKRISGGARALQIAKSAVSQTQNHNRVKNYIIKEGTPVPFLVLLGVMTADGKVVSSKYNKFRQINRFLEFIDDILPQIGKEASDSLKITDFGCGKSYLTFAVHYFLTEIKKIPVEITGLDLKKEVIDWCNKVSQQLNLKGIQFSVGDIATYSHKTPPDIVITLHACDTATDYALDYAVKQRCKVILSVPCCQKEVNAQLDENIRKWKKIDATPKEFAPLLKYGIIKERFSALLTDTLRADFLESNGYSVQIMEFIDMENTPKNLLIRAVKKDNLSQSNTTDLERTLEIVPTIRRLNH